MPRTESKPDITAAAVLLLPPKWEHFLIGGISGCFATILTSPVGVMKAHFQSHPSCKLTIWGYATHMYKTEGGLRPFFKGLLPSLIGIVPHRAVLFYSYHQYKDWCGRETRFNILSAGIFASLMANALTSPLWMLKAKCQLDRERSLVYHCKNIFIHHGFRGFYYGFFATCAGSVGEGFCFLIYEQLKSYLAKNNQQPTPLQCMIASGTTKLITALVFYPIEVVRIQLQGDSMNGSYQQILCKMWQEKKFYSGLSLHLPKTVISTVIMFGTFELLIKCTHI